MTYLYSLLKKAFQAAGNQARIAHDIYSSMIGLELRMTSILQ